MRKNLGFSLAEVLITLGIIGIVAAITIPVLFSNINNLKFRSQYKKAISTLSQAGLMAQAKYEYNFAGTQTPCSQDKSIAGSENPEEEMTFCAILNSTLTGYTYQGRVGDIKRMERNQNIGTYKLVKKDTIKDDYLDYLAYSLADGTLIAFNPQAKGCELSIGNRLVQGMFSGKVGNDDLSHCVGFIDVNGVTLPNTEVSCSAGTNEVGKDCIVYNNSGHMTDVYPVVFHDSTVEPASGAAQYILDSSK